MRRYGEVVTARCASGWNTSSPSSTAWGTPTITSSSSTLSSTPRTAGHSGGAGPRLRRGQPRGLLHRHHQHRPHPLQSAVRAVFEPRTGEHARLRRGLLLRAPAGGHRLCGAKSTAHDHVAQIITFGTMAARAAIRDVGRVLGMPYATVDTVAKLVPMELKMTLDRALEVSPELKAAYEADPQVQRAHRHGHQDRGHAAPCLHPRGGRGHHPGSRQRICAAGQQRRRARHPVSP